MNRVILMGNLTRDPETQNAGGTTVTRASIALNEKYKDSKGEIQEVVSFIDLTIFGKRGEAFAKYLRKGSYVALEGKLRQERWDDKETGAKRSRVKVIVDDWNFTHASNKDRGGQPSSPAPAQGGAGGMGDDVPF